MVVVLPERPFPEKQNLLEGDVSEVTLMSRGDKTAQVWT
jgi:hypothetical protein